MTTNLPARRPTIGLALGGGGARGLAHILMLEVLDDMGLKPTVIAGTSIGAVVGAAYASGLSARLIRAHAEEALGMRFDIVRQLLSARADPVRKILSFLPLRSSLFKPEMLLDYMLPSKVARDFSELEIPLKVIATDFHAQEQVIFETGPLRTAVAASMALPALFAPVIVNGRVLMDGGIVNPLPFDVLRGLADVIVAIDVSGAPVSHSHHPPPTAFAALMVSSQILQRSIVREKLKAEQPDIYIDVEVDEFHILGFHRFKHVMSAAEPARDRLRRQLERVLSAHTAETLPILAPQPAPPADADKSRRPRGLLAFRRNRPEDEK